MIPALFETALLWGFSLDQDTLSATLITTGVYYLVAFGLLIRVRLARLLAIFWACLVGIVTLVGSLLPILQMFPLQYFTLEAAVINGAVLLYVSGLFSAAIWLNRDEGKRWFGTAAMPQLQSPNKGFNRTPESSGPAKPGELNGGAG